MAWAAQGRGLWRQCATSPSISPSPSPSSASASACAREHGMQGITHIVCGLACAACACYTAAAAGCVRPSVRRVHVLHTHGAATCVRAPVPSRAACASRLTGLAAAGTQGPRDCEQHARGPPAARPRRPQVRPLQALAARPSRAAPQQNRRAASPALQQPMRWGRARRASRRSQDRKGGCSCGTPRTSLHSSVGGLSSWARAWAGSRPQPHLAVARGQGMSGATRGTRRTRAPIFAGSLWAAGAAGLQHHSAPVFVLHQRARRSYPEPAKILDRLRRTPPVAPVMLSHSEQPCTDCAARTTAISSDRPTHAKKLEKFGCFSTAFTRKLTKKCLDPILVILLGQGDR